MCRTLLTVHFSLFTALLLSCTPTPSSLTTSIILYRFDPPAFIEYPEDFQPIKEIPFSIPPNCGLFNTFPAPNGPILLIELSCPNGQTVLFLNVETESVSQPIINADAHFLAWTADGKAAYLKIDSLGSPQIVRVYINGAKDVLAIPQFTYDLSARPDTHDFTFTVSRGLGYGSELYLAQHDGRITTLLYADQFNYISYARFSPDGKQIAFIKIPDISTPFTVGELWLISSTLPSTADSANGASSSAQGGRFLSYVDAGHGYAANWSPDGTKIAFVMRENTEDENADRSSEALISNIYIVDIETGALTQTTHFTEGRAETPYWSPSGNILTFNVVLNGRMEVQSADIESGEIRSLETESTCCSAWMRK